MYIYLYSIFLIAFLDLHTREKKEYLSLLHTMYAIAYKNAPSYIHVSIYVLWRVHPPWFTNGKHAGVGGASRVAASACTALLCLLANEGYLCVCLCTMIGGVGKCRFLLVGKGYIMGRYIV